MEPQDIKELRAMVTKQDGPWPVTRFNIYISRIVKLQARRSNRDRQRNNSHHARCQTLGYGLRGLEHIPRWLQHAKVHPSFISTTGSLFTYILLTPIRVVLDDRSASEDLQQPLVVLDLAMVLRARRLVVLLTLAMSTSS